MKYTPRTKAMRHQTTGLARVRSRPRKPSSENVFAWLMEMGTGKTWLGVTEFGEGAMAGGLMDLLVIAPAGSYLNWSEDKSEEQQSELRAHLDPRVYAQLAVHSWTGNHGKRRKFALDSFLSDVSVPRAFVVNVEALSTATGALAACLRFVRAGRCTGIVDESTTIKNHRAKRTKNVMLIREHLRAARIMSGLATPRSPLDIYSQMAFLDWRILGFRSYYAFRARYAVMKNMDFGGRIVKIVVGYRNVEELQKKIAPYSYRVLKEDCLDLPPKVYVMRDVELTSEQRRMYDELREFATAKIETERFITATSVITQIIRLHQLVCGHVVDESGIVHDVKSNREDSLVELLGEHEGKAIVWVAYGHTLKNVAKRLAKEFGRESVACFWGGNKSTRGEDERRFLGDPRCLYMVATPGAGGRGNTWTVADLECYLANSNNLEHRLQSEDRPHRRGQKKKVTIVDFVAQGTVEIPMIRGLRKKIDMATTINGDNYREWLI